MGPEYITYRDVATHTEAYSQSGLAANATLVVPAVSITPVKNLLVLQGRVVATAQKVSGEALINGFFRFTWNFPDPSASGMADVNPTGFLRGAVKSGVMYEMYIMRVLPAGHAFELIPTSNTFALDVAPGIVWTVTVETTIFYIFLN